jgi:DNA-binding transcriptional LysR family regulator
VARKIDWETQVGRRLKLRDLHVFVTVAQRGSMAKAAVHLGVSQPAVSEVIADLEHALGVRLLDRSPHGIEPTIYGRTLLRRTLAAFDELKQGIRDMEFLANATVGELHIGCVESLASVILPPVIHRFSQAYPGVVVHVRRLETPTLALPELRDRSLDVALARIVRPPGGYPDDLNVEVLFDDHVVVAAGADSRWARRSHVDLAELADEPWVMTPPDNRPNSIIAEAFQARGLAMPKVVLTTLSIPLRANMVAAGPYISAFPSSVMRINAEQYALKVLPVDLPVRPWALAVVTVKNRTLSQVAQRFIDHVREFTSTMDVTSQPRRKFA